MYFPHNKHINSKFTNISNGITRLASQCQFNDHNTTKEFSQMLNKCAHDLSGRGWTYCIQANFSVPDFITEKTKAPFYYKFKNK